MRSSVRAVKCTQPRTVTNWGEERTVACGLRTCDQCGEQWEGDQRVRALAASSWLSGDVALITVTAPGAERFEPDHGGLMDHDPAAMKLHWNRLARRQWSALHRAASKVARRTARERGCDWRVLYRSWEYQKRGLLHVHLVLPFGTREEKEATGRYVADLWSLARAYDFGYVLGGSRRDTPGWQRPPRVAAAGSRRAASYVAKYVASIGSGKESMRTVAQRTAKRGSVLYISHKLTRASGVTMGSLRARRRIAGRYPWAMNSRRSWRAACAADGATRGTGPLTAASEAALRAHLLSTQPQYLWDHRTAEVIEPTFAHTPTHLLYEPEPPPLCGGATPLGLASVRVHVPNGPPDGVQRTRALL